MKKFFLFLLLSVLLVSILVACVARSDDERVVEGKVVGFSEIGPILGLQMIEIFWEEDQHPNIDGRLFEWRKSYSSRRWLAYPVEKISKEYVGRTINKKLRLTFHKVAESWNDLPIIYIVNASFE